MRFRIMRGDRHGNKDQREPGEDKRLDSADEQLEPVEGYRQHPGHEEGGNQEQYFPGGHVAEETKSETDNGNKTA